METLGILITVMVAGIVIGFSTAGIFVYLKGAMQRRKAKKLIEEKEVVFEGKKGLDAFQEEVEEVEQVVSEEVTEVLETPKKIPKKIQKPKPIEDGLQDCIICGKRTESNTCCQEHYNQAMAEYYTQLSDGSDRPKKEGEVKSLKDVSDTTPSS